MHFSRVIGGLALWGVIGSVMANLTYETMRNLTAATDESRERILGVGEAWGAEVLGEGKQVVVGGGRFVPVYQGFVLHFGSSSAR